jgi:hypothetical protein
LPHFDFFVPPDRPQQVNQVFDFSQLNGGSDDFGIDSGVTSGADSTSWDEINIDRDGRVDSCDDAGGGEKAAAVCKEARAHANEKK